MINFMKNVAMLGGLMLVIARGAGLCSIDNLRSHKAEATPPRVPT